MSEEEKPRGINILCIDGGGVRGLSSLVLLGEIMGRLGELDGRYERPDPVEYFDVIAGTGTGGVSACMLGRLHMSLSQTITAYTKLLSEVFSDKKALGTNSTSAYKGSKLRLALRLLVKNAAGDENERMIDEATSDLSKTIVFAMSKQNLNASVPVLFRSYVSTRNPAPDCTIWEAMYATMAHPDLFKSIDIDDGPIPLSFVGGEVGCSNPISHVLTEVSRLYPDRHVSCILSIGAGHARTISLPEPGLSKWIMSTSESTVIKDMPTDSEREATAMATRFQNTSNVYYRFNVDQGMQDIDMQGWEKLGEVMAHTRAYISKLEPGRGIDQAARALKERKSKIPVTLLDGSICISLEEKVAEMKRCPAPSSVFTGREDLIQNVGTCITSGTNERRVCVVHGLGGAGKTQLALKTIERYRDHWIHVLYMDASSREAIRSTLQDIAKAKNIGKTSEDTLRWLETSCERWLLVYDNADNPSLHIHEYFPAGNRGSILITTRLSDMRVHARGPSSECRISQMNHEDALMLLLKLAHVQGQSLAESETKAANTLLKDFGHLALAIVHAGAYIGHSQMLLSKYRDLFLARRRSMLERYGKLKVKVDSYQWTVFTTWKLCYDLLEENGESRPLLWLIAYMHHDRISESTFERAAIDIQGYKPEFPMTEVEIAARDYLGDFLSRFLDEDGGWDTSIFCDAISELTSYSLIDYDRINAVYSIHVLVQGWARTVIDQPPELALECTTTLLAHAVEWGNTIQTHRSRAALGLHMVKVLSEHDNKISNNHALRFTEVLRGRGLWDLQEELETRVKEARARLYGEGDMYTLRSMGNLAATYGNQGRWRDSEELSLKVLNLRKQTLGEEHLDTVLGMANLALTYRLQGRWNEAEQLQDKALGVRRRTLGEEHPDTLTIMADLASTYEHQDRWKEAEQLHVKVLGVRRRTLSEAHPDTLSSMAHLAMIYRHQGLWSMSEQLQVKVLDARRRTLGGEHLHTLSIMVNLASTYSWQGRWDEAEQLQLKALDAYRRALGEDHPDTLTTNNNLALTYLRQGRWKEAEQLQLKILEAHKRTLGEEHPDTLMNMNSLAATYSEQGRWSEAEQVQRKVIDAEIRALSGEHPKTLRSMSNLVSTYINQGRWNEAEQLGLEVLDAQRRTVGEEHLTTLATMHHLAAIYSQQWRWVEAEKLDLMVLGARRRKLGEEHPDTLISSNNLASVYSHQGRWNEAEQLYLVTLDARKRTLGDEHPDTLMTWKHLASVYEGQGRYSEAEELHTTVLDKRKQILGEEHPSTLVSMGCLASIYSTQDRQSEAEQLELKVLAGRRRTLGEEHPDTLISMNNLALTYASQGRRDEAEMLLAQVVEARARTIGDQHPTTIRARKNLASLSNDPS